MKSTFRLALLALVASGLGVAAAPANQSVSYSARVVNFERPQGRAPNLLQIRVSRWSTDTERDHLTDVLSNDGQKAFLKELSKLPEAGTIRTPDTAGYTFRYARRVESAAGEQLLMIVDRPLEFTEFRQGWQTVDYPFTIVQMDLNDKGEGEGSLMPAARLAVKKPAGDIKFEPYSASPYLLKSVRRED